MDTKSAILNQEDHEGKINRLTAKKVPGKKTIVTKAIDLICFESLLVANAISTFVSPCACRLSALIIRNKGILESI